MKQYDKLNELIRKRDTLASDLIELKKEEVRLRLEIQKIDFEISVYECLGGFKDNFEQKENVLEPILNNKSKSDTCEKKVNVNTNRNTKNENNGTRFELDDMCYKSFFNQYNPSLFRSMMKLSLLREIAEELSNKSYAEWINDNRSSQSILLQKATDTAIFYASMVSYKGTKYLLVGTRPDLDLTEDNVKSMALNKFFIMDDELDFTLHKKLVLEKPAIFMVRDDEYYEFVAAGYLKFQ